MKFIHRHKVWKLRIGYNHNTVLIMFICLSQRIQWKLGKYYFSWTNLWFFWMQRSMSIQIVLLNKNMTRDWNFIWYYVYKNAYQHKYQHECHHNIFWIMIYHECENSWLGLHAFSHKLRVSNIIRIINSINLIL